MARKKNSTKPVGAHKRNTSGLKRGGPGRPKGVPNKVTQEVREWARGIMEDPLVQAKTLKQAQEGKLPPAVFTTILAYAYGKPKDELEISGKDGAPVAFTWLPPQLKPPSKE